MCVCMCVCVYVRACMRACVRAYVRACMRACVDKCVSIHLVLPCTTVNLFPNEGNKFYPYPEMLINVKTPVLFTLHALL